MPVDPAAFVQQGRKIVAIGRNYAEHIKELSNDAPKEPMFFIKPTTSYLPSGGNVEIPRGVTAHYEVELGLVVGKTGRDISQADAVAHVAGYALAVDMTARNMQDVVKKKGHPWSAVKGFDTFTPISLSRSGWGVWFNGRPDCVGERCHEAGRQHQPDDFQDPAHAEHISSIMTLEAGDLVLTGTPSGVGPLVPGDHVACTLTDSSGTQLAALEFRAVQREGGYSFQP
ncbi:uncharacterized protein B0H18DRAFT_1087085 [Fomitopsis serialis]|uniref:uncharacterized protein n=1 Tax=Fomitopsis serialis TaxID=139415 RepID=UPI0020087D88|nr:uncharacterized protein B0H18DRAFT_1087085 [Neoantrodia serialis]KAH9917440.1 hypothetical protein B0H18DRAFT_1087085 [Neoantrodia serialis]